jgi:hypothetical protein
MSGGRVTASLNLFRTDTIDGVVSDNRPLPFRQAIRALGRCAATTAVLLSKRGITQPKDHVGDMLHFADGSTGRVYRETVVRDAPSSAPVVLVVGFRLRMDPRARSWPLSR